MQYSPKSPQYCRDKALEYLKRGRDLFNSKKDSFQKEAGYEMFKKGIEKMIEFAKLEKDPNLSQLLKDQLKETLLEARMMESVLTQIPEKDEEDDLSQRKGKSFLSLITGKQGNKTSKKEGTPIFKTKELSMEDELFIEQSMLVTEKPYSWDSIPDNFVKKNLEEAILNPLKYPSVFSAFENSWRSILFYGMAGSGKTYTLKALASKLNMNYLFASSSDFISIYIGDGERILKNLFTYAIQRQPAVIVIDEIDCFFYNSGEGENSNRMKTELLMNLMNLQSLNASVIFIGVTNEPSKLGQTVKRFDRKIYMPLPDRDSRETIIRRHLSKYPSTLTNEHIQYLCEITEGYSYADIDVVMRSANMEPLRKMTQAQYFKIIEYKNNIPMYTNTEADDPDAIPMTLFDILPQNLHYPKLNFNHFLATLEKSKPSITKEYADRFERTTRELFAEDREE